MQQHWQPFFKFFRYHFDDDEIFDNVEIGDGNMMIDDPENEE